MMAYEDEELRPLIETIISVLILQTGQSVWYFDPAENTINIIELPDVTFPNARTIIMSATLPPSLLTNTNTIVIRRGWSIQAKIDAKYTLTIENIKRRGDEIGRHVSRYLAGNTVVFTTLSREGVLPISGDVTWEDELVEKGKTPCDFKDRIVVLKVFGRYAEGVDLNCFSRLIVLGPPLLPPHAMARLRARGISDVEFMTLKTAQILGRPIRSAEKPNTLPEIILIDRRFELIKDNLRNYEIQAQLET